MCLLLAYKALIIWTLANISFFLEWWCGSSDFQRQEFSGEPALVSLFVLPELRLNVEA